MPKTALWFYIGDTHVLSDTGLAIDGYKAKRMIRSMQQRGEIDAGRMIGKFRWYRVLKAQ